MGHTVANDLKPCPFCGAEIDDVDDIPGKHSPSCFMQAVVRCGVTDEELNNAWNNRVGHIDAEKISEAMVDCLQSAFAADPNAMHSLVCNSVPCNQALADHPHVVVNDVPVLTAMMYRVSMVGVICGILDAAGLPKIAHKWSGPIFEDGGSEFLGFCRYQPPDEVKVDAGCQTCLTESGELTEVAKLIGRCDKCVDVKLSAVGEKLGQLAAAAKTARVIEHLAECGASVNYPLPTVMELWEIFCLLQDLRHEEGATIEFCCRNPEPCENNLPPECVSINDKWTHWTSKDFRGESLLECLQKAMHARREEYARNPDFRSKR